MLFTSKVRGICLPSPLLTSGSFYFLAEYTTIKTTTNTIFTPILYVRIKYMQIGGLYIAELALIYSL